MTSVIVGRNGRLIEAGMIGGKDDTLANAFNVMWRDNIFQFSAQRFGLGRSAFGNPPRLLSDASNLPAVLNKLQGERPETFQLLIEHLQEIFSTVRSVSVIPTVQNELEIRVWPSDNRSDPALSFGLDNSGTGVSQAIAMLAVVLTMDNAVIVIDEIGSFLHPAAAKTLLRILQTRYPSHQYVVSTHSSEVIAATSPNIAYLIRKEGFESSANVLDLKKLEDLREVSGRIGVSMGDVFAADRLIWVEGPRRRHVSPSSTRSSSIRCHVERCSPR